MRYNSLVMTTTEAFARAELAPKSELSETRAGANSVLLKFAAIARDSVRIEPRYLSKLEG
jgi:hypothetical protein